MFREPVNDYILTINVPVVYMAQDVNILMRANPLQGPLEGMGPENQNSLGPENQNSLGPGMETS
jgi:hypothetical protein